MLLVCLPYFYHGFEGQPLLKVNVSDWGNLASPCYWQYISYFFLCPSSSDVLALPIFKQEESSLPSDNENMILPFQYVLCAPTSPAVKLHDETLTYLNQGQHQCVQEFICVGKELTAAKNKNHWQVIHFFMTVSFRHYLIESTDSAANVSFWIEFLCKIHRMSILHLQVSPMKLECLTIGKLGNFQKLLVKWWRWELHMWFTWMIINKHHPWVYLNEFL